ncbi:MAG: hypothetical protein DCF32_20470 [Leptolyngbya sp.]|nr:MAG: hypothetical protein DCF32_20470 [Leptolyngbya sp.]
MVAESLLGDGAQRKIGETGGWGSLRRFLEKKIPLYWATVATEGWALPTIREKEKIFQKSP